MEIHTDNTETLNAALRLIADIHSAVGDPDGKLTSKQLLARINAMTVTLTALTSGEDHNQIINRVTTFAEALK